VKRGWITWDQTELPREAFEARVDGLRQYLAERGLPAALIYADVWRSNRARHFSNFMPYWNRALLVVPCDGPPTLLCSLSPRVYPWIRSVTILEDIRPSPNLAQQFLALAGEKGWKRLGVLDLAGLPVDMALQQTVGQVSELPFELVDVAYPFAPDQWELAMYRKAAKMARAAIEEELAAARGLTDYEFTSRLERKLRRAGTEDLVILVTNGAAAPAPARGETLGNDFSVALALEYRGHWVKIIRSASSRDPFPTHIHVETLSGPYPYEVTGRLEMPAILAFRFESQTEGLRLFHGDTYVSGDQGLELL
jgi:hypothetical protein